MQILKTDKGKITIEYLIRLDGYEPGGKIAGLSSYIPLKDRKLSITWNNFIGV